MAIETDIPARTDKLIFEAFHMDLGGKEVIVTFKVENSEERWTARSAPTEWAELLKFLFDNLTNAKQLKTRVQDWLKDTGKISGTIVPD